MTLTDRANRALKQIDAELAVCDAATPGKWLEQSDEIVAEVLEFRPIARAYGTRTSSQEDKKNAAFIATARTGYPAALKGLKVAIESLLKRHTERERLIQSYTEKHRDYDPTCDFATEYAKALNSILAIWEESHK